MTSNPQRYGLSKGYPDAVVIADPDTRGIIETNRAAADLFGRSGDELCSMEILALHPSEDRERYRVLFDQHFENQPATISRFEDGSPVYVVTADGQHVPVEINAWVLEEEVHGHEPPLFQGVFRDISVRLDYERRLEEQRDGLKVLNQILRHDVRNDLQLVTAYAEILTDYVDEDGKEYLTTIRTSATNAVELTQSAHDMAEVMLTTEDDSHPVNLRNTLEAKLEEIRSAYPGAAITVEGSIPATTVSANDMLASVFRNLLTNAIEHNDKEVAKIRVSVTEHDQTVRVRIADNGPGVPDDRTETIFGKGEKGLESEGTGIGLYLVETLVDSYGGDVWVEDVDSKGAVFVVELPLARGS